MNDDYSVSVGRLIVSQTSPAQINLVTVIILRVALEIPMFVVKDVFLDPNGAK